MRPTIITQLIEIWEKLTPSQRTSCGLGTIILIIAISVAVSVASRPKFIQLYGNLALEDASVVVAKLKEMKVPYRTLNDGTTIEIPENQIDDVRLSLAGEDIPRGNNTGFELFDKTQMGESEFAERVKYTRAVQGELERTIRKMDFVADVRVHLALPERSVLMMMDQGQKPSASVVLSLRGPVPSAQSIRAIVHLVSLAVVGMEPQNVAVVDTQGNLLTDMAGVLDDSGSDGHMQFQRDQEEALEKRLQSMLDRSLGIGKSIVTAHVQLNFDKTQIDRETYGTAVTPVGNASVGTVGNTTSATGSATAAIPPNATAGTTTASTTPPPPQGVLENQQSVDETYAGGSPTIKGAVSVATPQVSSSANGTGGYHHTETSNAFRVPREAEHIDVAPGQVERTSLSLLVDKSVPAAVSEQPEAFAGSSGGHRSRPHQ